jgi:hypothetical protein
MRWSVAVPDLEQLLGRLIKQRVEFVIIGGFAAVAHGASRFTQDVDICCRFTPVNLLRLQQAVADLHPVHRLTPQRLPLELTRQNCARLRNLYLETDYGIIDCLSEVLGIGDFNAVRKASVTLNLPFGSCRILDLDALIKAKEAMNRPRDREAVLQLRAIKQRRTKQKRR